MEPGSLWVPYAREPCYYNEEDPIYGTTSFLFSFFLSPFVCLQAISLLISTFILSWVTEIKEEDHDSQILVLITT